MRKRGREVQDSDGAITGRVAGFIPAQHGSLDLDDFRKALERLPEDQREAIILIGASGFSYEEGRCNLRVRRGNDQEPREPRAVSAAADVGHFRRG